MTVEKTAKLQFEDILENAYQEAEKHKNEAPQFIEFSSIPLPGTKELNEADNGVFDMDIMQESIDSMSTNYEIQAWRPLTSGIPVLGAVILFFKKLFRKLIKFYIEPIVNDQTNINRNAAIVSNEFANYIELQQKNQQLTEARIHGLENKILDLYDQNRQLQEEVNRLKSEKSEETSDSAE